MPADPGASDVHAVVGDVPAARAASGSLAEVVRAGYGQRVLDDLVTPLVGGSIRPRPSTRCGGRPGAGAGGCAGRRDATAGGGQPGRGHRYLGARHGLRGGMHTAGLLVSAADEAGAELRCGDPVRELSRRPGGWRVTTARRQLDADVVVLAVPLDVAVRLLGGRWCR